MCDGSSLGQAGGSEADSEHVRQRAAGCSSCPVTEAADSDSSEVSTARCCHPLHQTAVNKGVRNAMTHKELKTEGKIQQIWVIKPKAQDLAGWYLLLK